MPCNIPGLTGGCFVCSDSPLVYGLPLDYETGEFEGVSKLLPNTERWAIVPDITESDKKRTSHTGGKFVKPCPDALDYRLEVTSAPCPTDWIWRYLLEPQGGFVQDMSRGRCLAFFCTWDPTQLPSLAGVSGITAHLAMQNHSDRGFYLIGAVNPGGMEIDGNTNGAASTEWTANVYSGPWGPKQAGADFSADQPLPT